MSEQLLTVLKFCLLALLYLFFLRVLRSVWVEISGPKGADQPAPAPAPVAMVGAAPTAGPPADRSRKRGRRQATQLVIVEPDHLRGATYEIGLEMTVGRAAGCGIVIDDTYASQVHARVFARDGQVFVEDLGSTNGTLLNQNKVGGPTTMSRGDHLQVGHTVLEVA